MFKYQFEFKEEITSCENCPCVYGGYEDFGEACSITNNMSTDFKRIPTHCPLVKIESEVK